MHLPGWPAIPPGLFSLGAVNGMVHGRITCRLSMVIPFKHRKFVDPHRLPTLFHQPEIPLPVLTRNAPMKRADCQAILRPRKTGCRPVSTPVAAAMPCQAWSSRNLAIGDCRPSRPGSGVVDLDPGQATSTIAARRTQCIHRSACVKARRRRGRAVHLPCEPSSLAGPEKTLNSTWATRAHRPKPAPLECADPACRSRNAPSHCASVSRGNGLRQVRHPACL